MNLSFLTINLVHHTKQTHYKPHGASRRVTLSERGAVLRDGEDIRGKDKENTRYNGKTANAVFGFNAMVGLHPERMYNGMIP